MIYLVALNTLLFLSISALHFCWAIGGEGRSAAVVPSKANGELLFNPGRLSTLIMGFGLLLFSGVMIGNLGVFDRFISPAFFRYGAWAIALIFLARAIGDFKFVGFFKRKSSSRFARNDTQLYSPLSLLMGTVSLLVGIWART